MGINDWRYYNHAVIPSTGPHEEPDISCIKNKSIWKLNGGGYRLQLDGQQILIADMKQVGGML